MVPGEQPEFSFDPSGNEDGYRGWQDQRRAALDRLAAQMGLPLGRKVEVWLRGEIRLVGVLRMRHETLFLPEKRDNHMELIVDNVPFLPSEIQSCVAID